MKRLNRSTNTLALACSLALVALLAPGASEAQMVHYSGKFVCGFELGNVRLLNDPTPFPSGFAPDAYEDLKPGNYATAFNILNASLSDVGVFAFATVPGTPAGSVFLMSLPISSFNAVSLGCPEIVTALGPNFPLPLNGTAFEGFITFFTAQANLKVDVVYTYESQNAFERHALWEYTPAEFIGPLINFHHDQLGEISNPVGNTFTDVLLRNEAATASGAGGLGLGVSIDIETIEPGIVATDGLQGGTAKALSKFPELQELLH